MVVNGPAWADGSSLSKRLHSFIHEFVDAAQDATVTPGRARFLELPAGSPEKRKEFEVGDSSDGIGHSCEVVLDKDTGKVMAAVFTAGTMKDRDHHDAFCFRVTPSGVLEHVALVHVLFKDGKTVRGAGTAETVDPEAPGIREKFQHELDFWLKGKYRKKAGKTSAAPAAAQQ